MRHREVNKKFTGFFYDCPFKVSVKGLKFEKNLKMTPLCMHHC